MTLADLVKRAGHQAGVEIARYRPYAARRMKCIRQSAIATVIDVGANEGQYGRMLRELGFEGPIISLEPLAEPFAKLRALADDDWLTLNVGAGREDCEATMNVASNVASSSILTMRDEHALGAPDVRIVATEVVRLRRLDSFAFHVEAPVLLKLDVQGYEAEVLAGAGRTLGSVTVIDCELSLAPLYENQPSFREMIDLLAELGFAMFDMDPFWRDKSDGRVLSLDGLFARDAESFEGTLQRQVRRVAQPTT